MTSRSEWLSAGLEDYILAHSTPHDDLLSQLAAETASSFPDAAGMQIGAEQGTFMTMLTRLAGARRALEIGTFTGYSSICIARGLADRGALQLRPAAQTLQALPGDERFDLAFIDADKGGYIGYWDAVLPRIRPGGLILVDNSLFGGQAADPATSSEGAQAIRRFNDHAVADSRVELVLLSIGDGLTVACKR